MAKEFRFAVGVPNETSSMSWKFFTSGDEAYLLSRGPAARHHKFSFHKSRNCRWAEIDPAKSGSERAFREWTYDPIPARGSGRASLLLRMVFPTSHLSVPGAAIKPAVSWIPPAPAGDALGIEFMLSGEGPEAVAALLTTTGDRRLLRSLVLRSGNWAHVTATVFNPGPVKLDMPGEPAAPGQVFGDLTFPEEDTRNSGRPVRMMLLVTGDPVPEIWELGGYEERSLEQIASLTERRQ